MSKFDATFVISVYNKQAYVNKTLRTIEQQVGDYNIQTVVIDDGSTDNTFKILAHKLLTHKDEDKYILIGKENNEGISKAFNEAHEHVQSDIIIIASGDDLYAPDRAKQTIEFFRLNPDVDVTYGSFVRVNRFGQLIEEKPALNFEENKLVLYQEFGQFVPHGFMAFRTKCLEKVSYNNDRRVGIDHEFILDLYEAGYKFKEMEAYKDGKLNSMGCYVNVPKCVSEVYAKEIRQADKEMLCARKK